jgi:hypothetical protein
MRLMLIPTGSILLAACTGPASDAKAAERQYEMIKRNGGSKQEICEASRRVADAWLKAENENKYKFASITRDLDCNAALLESR